MATINKDRNWIDRDEAYSVVGLLVIDAEATDAVASNIVTEGTELNGYEIYKAISEDSEHRVEVIYLLDSKDMTSSDLSSIDADTWTPHAYAVEVK